MTNLSLEACDLTDDDLKMIATMTNIKSLSINFSAFTVDGLRHLAGLPHLETLQMESPLMGPQAIDALHGFRKLRSLRIQTSSWSESDRERLQQALPKDCKIVSAP